MPDAIRVRLRASTRSVFEARHQWPEAYAALKHVKDTYRADYLRGSAEIAAASGDRRRAAAAMAELKDYALEHYVSPIVLASYEAQFGDRERAFKWLERGYRERATGMIFLRVKSAGSREFPTVVGFNASKAFRSDPRFAELVRRVGFR